MKKGWRANFKAQHKFDKALAQKTSKETGGKVIVQWKQGALETAELSSIARKQAQDYWKNNADARKFHYAEIRYVGAFQVAPAVCPWSLIDFLLIYLQFHQQQGGKADRDHRPLS